MLQKDCETVEELLAKDSACEKGGKLTMTEFVALNNILLHLQVKGDYKIPEGVH